MGYEPKGDFTPHPSGTLYADLADLLTAATLCNNSRLNPPSSDHPQWTCLGDQTEAALRVVAIKGGVEEAWANRTFPRIHELPFDARRKRMSTIHQMPRNQKSDNPEMSEIAFVKGRPKRCFHSARIFSSAARCVPLDDATRAEIMAANDDYARNALRVLALARRELPSRDSLSAAGEDRSGAMYTPEKVEQDLTFLGLLAMMDPPRPEVAAAVKAAAPPASAW